MGKWKATSKALSTIAAGALAISVSTPIFAEHGGYHPYVGAFYGGYKARGDAFDDDNDYFEVVGGLKFNPYWGVEAAYTNFGDFSEDFGSADVDGFGVSTFGAIPISDNTDIYGRVGVFFSTVDVEFAGYSDGFDDEQLFYGLGIDFAVWDPLHIAVEYSRYKIGMDIDVNATPVDVNVDDPDTDVDTFKVGAKYMF